MDGGDKSRHYPCELVPPAFLLILLTQAVQPHMGKCFDGIRCLDFGDDPKSTDIYAMVSGTCGLVRLEDRDQVPVEKPKTVHA